MTLGAPHVFNGWIACELQLNVEQPTCYLSISIWDANDGECTEHFKLVTLGAPQVYQGQIACELQLNVEQPTCYLSMKYMGCT